MRTSVTLVLAACALIAVSVSALPSENWEYVGAVPWVNGAGAGVGRDGFAVAPWLGSDAGRGLLLFGGRSDRNGVTAPGVVYNDVYSSSNGFSWAAQPQAPWAARTGHHGLLVSTVTMMFGGYDITATGGASGTYFRDTWYTSTGASWVRTSSSAGWGARYNTAACAVQLTATRAEALLFGGVDATTGTVYADVWRSYDFGASWSLVFWQSQGLAAFGARSGASLVSVDGVPYLMGGMSPSLTALSDVWRGTDGGATWTRVASAPAFTARYQFAAVSADTTTRIVSSFYMPCNGATPSWNTNVLSSMYITGGEQSPGLLFGDAWAASQSSLVMTPVPAPSGGVFTLASAFTQLRTTSNATSPLYVAARKGHASVVYGGYLYVYGGMQSSGVLRADIVRRFVGDPNAPAPYVSNCTAGRYSAGAGIPCALCPPGTYSPTTGASSCTPCPSGMYTATVGSSFCTTCSFGTFSVAGASRCTSCPAGTFAGTSGLSSCRTCPTGQWSYSGEGMCRYCPMSMGGVGCSSYWVEPTRPSSGLSRGAVAGIVVGSVCVFALLCAVVYVCVRRRRTAAAGAAAAPPAGSAVVVVVPGGKGPASAPYSVVPPAGSAVPLVAIAPGQSVVVVTPAAVDPKLDGAAVPASTTVVVVQAPQNAQPPVMGQQPLVYQPLV